jgi:3-oxoadipate enol-lactonase
VLVDTGAHMRGHGDVDAILNRIRSDWNDELRAAVIDRSFCYPLAPEVRAGHLEWAANLSQQAVYDVLASQRDLAQSLPDAEFRLVEAGHTPVYEIPDAVAAVRDVLSRAGQRGASYSSMIATLAAEADPSSNS